MSDDLTRYPEHLRGDSSMDALMRRQHDEQQRSMHRFRRFHLIMLVVILIATAFLVLSRGFDSRGVIWLGVVALLVAYRWRQFRRSPPAV